ncbi:uncharacterized protein LTR77_009206 [Saxophila tyrrhenica]|uniref:Snf7-domain-containing protein n=1 Tax=Saxophila tyrrhenica TaxID=1690608 RepID=A0AAV9P0B4_9PEZI|nr:hypothetical protein LTR77_009206 [Saxophila tyrrhenica]
MPTLQDFLRDFDEAFRSRARLASLYSDFRFQKASNPDGYTANTTTWIRALSAAAQAGLIPGPPGAEANTFTLRSGEELARALQTQEYGRPLALGAAIEEAVRKREFVGLKGFLNAKGSVYARSWIPTPWQVVSWTLRQLGVVGEGGEDRLVEGEFVVMANVESAAKAVLSQASQISTSHPSRIFTPALFTSTFAPALEILNLSPTDLSVLLTHLSRDRSAISYSPATGTIKFASPSEPHSSPITDEDVSIANLRALIASLETQTTQLTAQISTLDQKAREAVTSKQPAMAKSALRSKKLTQTKLDTRTATLSQMEEIYAKIEQAADQVELVRVMEASSSTLKSLNKQTGGVEKVQDVADGLREEMTTVEEIGGAINEVSAGTVDEGEVEDELEAMERGEKEKERKVVEEREKEERKVREERDEREAEETRRKFAELDRVVAAGTPVGEQNQQGDSKTEEEENAAKQREEAA